MIQRLEPDLCRVIVLVGLVMAMLIVAHIDVALAIVSVPSSRLARGGRALLEGRDRAVQRRG